MSNAIAFNGKIVGLDGSSGDSLLPHLTIYSDAGSTVTVVLDTTTITATETEEGVFECDVDSYGTWTIHSVFNNIDKTVDVIVDTVKVYEVNAYHWKATITTNFPYSIGVECTCSNNGQVILTANTSPYTFNIYNAGTYTVDFMYKGRKTYQTVVVSEDGEALICDYTPSVAYQDDVPIWLWFGGVDEDYYSVTDVASDKDAMVKLMSSNDAVDYAKASIDIANSYTIPHMTSNTSPSGVVSASSNNETAYKVFSQNRDRMGSSCSWNPVSDETNSYLRYDYGKATTTNSILYRLSGTLGNVSSYTIKIQGSDDETNWTTISTISVTSISSSMVYNKSYTASTYRYIQLLFEDTIQSTSGGARFKIYGAQFYNNTMAQCENVVASIGASDYASNKLLTNTIWRNNICYSEYFESVLNTKAPTMTSNTTPSGECFGSSYYSGHPYYYAFDGNDSSEWYSNGTSAGEYIGYKFESPTVIQKVVGVINVAWGKYKIQASNDSANWIDLTSELTARPINAIFSNSTAYLYYRILVTGRGSGSASSTVYTAHGLQFYGRADGGVQDWLRAGGITDKDYTTLAEVLNDSTALTTLMSSEDAVDYLVTCTQWADTICSDQTAMSYIGLNNYASNTLLADETWCEAICNSTYFESVLNVKVPTMTSNTTPSGEVSAQSYYSGREPYLAFDGNSSTRWNGSTIVSTGQSISEWIKYKFTQRVSIKRLSYNYNSANTTLIIIEGSNDNSTFREVARCSNVSQGGYTYAFTNPDDYQYYRLTQTQTNNTTGSAALPTAVEIQLYGRVDV